MALVLVSKCALPVSMIIVVSIRIAISLVGFERQFPAALKRGCREGRVLHELPNAVKLTAPQCSHFKPSVRRLLDVFGYLWRYL